LQVGNNVPNLVCVASADSNTGAFAGKRARNRASNAARSPEHDGISSSQA
jgi:hypothetical protein